MTPGAQRQALRWLLSPDCAEVIALCGYDPELIQARLARMVERYQAGHEVLPRRRWPDRAA